MVCQLHGKNGLSYRDLPLWSTPNRNSWNSVNAWRLWKTFSKNMQARSAKRVRATALRPMGESAPATRSSGLTTRNNNYKNAKFCRLHGQQQSHNTSYSTKQTKWRPCGEPNLNNMWKNALWQKYLFRRTQTVDTTVISRNEISLLLKRKGLNSRRINARRNRWTSRWPLLLLTSL